MSDYDPKENKDSSILDKMSVLFLGAVGAKAFLKKVKGPKDKKNESVLREQTNKPNFADDLAVFFDDSGASDEFKKDAKVVVDSLQSALKEFNDAYEERKELLKSLAASENLEDFTQALGDSQKDLQEVDNLGALKKDIESAVEKLVKSEEFKNQVKEETGKEEVSDEDLKKAAQKVVFLDAKKNLEQELGGFEEGLKKYAQSIGEQVKDLLPSDAGMKILKKSKNATDVVNLIEKTKQQYFIA